MGLVSKVTERVIEKVHEWQNRPLDPLYPIVYLDCLVLKIRENQRVINKSLYLALGINMEGHKELLGLWLAETEGAKYWLSVLTELKNRGLEDILIACVDGLKGFPDAIAVEYPQTKVQLCIVHMVRNSLRYVSWKVQPEHFAPPFRKQCSSARCPPVRGVLLPGTGLPLLWRQGVSS